MLRHLSIKQEDCELFELLKFEPLKNDKLINSQIRWGHYKGIYALYRFANDYGVHVLQYDPNSQPGKALGPFIGTYELRVVRYVNDKPQLVYDTSITNDVVAQLLPEQISTYMKQVQEL